MAELGSHPHNQQPSHSQPGVRATKFPPLPRVATAIASECAQPRPPVRQAHQGPPTSHSV
eukprot:15440032-Alexandrium_andersonii.AAC.1